MAKQRAKKSDKKAKRKAAQVKDFEEVAWGTDPEAYMYCYEHGMRSDALGNIDQSKS